MEAFGLSGCNSCALPQSLRPPHLGDPAISASISRGPPVARDLIMSAHPVQFHVQPTRMGRTHVAIRLAILLALSSIGCSSAYWLLFLALPVIAALLISRDGDRGYFDRDAPQAIRVLRWFAGAYAYLWLLTDATPADGARGPVELTVEVTGKPTVGSAFWRLLLSLPALLLLAALSIVAAVLWVVGALSVLAVGRVPAVIVDFVAMKLRYQFRLVAYHLSLVDVYPAVADSPQQHAPQTRGA
jgi:hypothetical protein